jgi:guanylate kinase
MAGILFIISAPSGSGKSTLVSEVRRLVPGLEFSISYTTRAPRGSEEDGREYHFTDKATFEQMIADGDFLEYATVFGDHYYGTAVSALDQAREHGHDLLLDIDVQGALQVMKKMPQAVSIFILPPTPEVERLEDYRYALVNDLLDEAASEMRAIVLVARQEGDANDAELAAECLTSARSTRLSAALESFGVTTAGV